MPQPNRASAHFNSTFPSILFALKQYCLSFSIVALLHFHRPIPSNCGCYQSRETTVATPLHRRQHSTILLCMSISSTSAPLFCLLPISLLSVTRQLSVWNGRLVPQSEFMSRPGRQFEAIGDVLPGLPADGLTIWSRHMIRYVLASIRFGCGSFQDWLASPLD